MRLAPLLLLAFAGCDTESYYLYTAHQYDPKLGCVTDLAVLDVEIGPDPGSSCAAKCVTAPDSDGGVAVYASTMCGPTPYGADISGTHADCAPALAALAGQDFCLEGGTSSNPVDAGDAGSE